MSEKSGFRLDIWNSKEKLMNLRFYEICLWFMLCTVCIRKTTLANCQWRTFAKRTFVALWTFQFHIKMKSTIVLKEMCFFFVSSFIYSLVNQTMADLDAGRVRRVISDALNVWARGSRLKFQEQLSAVADIQVLFTR